MADYKHVNTADYEDRKAKIERERVYSELTRKVGGTPDPKFYPNRDLSFLETMASQPPLRKLEGGGGIWPLQMHSFDYGPDRGYHEGRTGFARDLNSFYSSFPSYRSALQDWGRLQANQSDLYHNPDKYLKNFDPKDYRAVLGGSMNDAHPNAHAFYSRDEGTINQLMLNSSRPLEVLPHEVEHLNQHKHPVDAYRLPSNGYSEMEQTQSEGLLRALAKILITDDTEIPSPTSRWSDSRRENYKNSIDKQLKNLDSTASREFMGYTGQRTLPEKLAEIRRLQSLQPYNTLPTSPLEQGGMYMRPIQRK